MNFMVKDFEGKEHGPLNEDTLIKWTDAGNINAETPMRNALMAQWKKASDFNFLKEALARQTAEKEKEKTFMQKLGDSKKKSTPDLTSAFEYKYLPDPASLFQRLASTFFDFVLLSVPAVILYITASFVFYFSDINSNVPIPEDKPKAAVASKDKDKEKVPVQKEFQSEANPQISDNVEKGFVAGSRWKNNATSKEFVCVASFDTHARWVDASLYNNTVMICVLVFFTIFVLYYGLLLGLYAQTFGMWFWGIFIVKPNLDEVYLLRALVFTIAMIVTGIASPFLVFVSSSRRSVDDVLSGVILLKIAGKPKS